jgi:hypothetical protein
MADLTDSLTVFADYTKTLLEDPAWMTTTGIKRVSYGDVEKVDIVPLVCVEPSDKARDFNGAPRRTQINFEVYVLIYFGALASSQDNRRETDQIAEAVETRLHSDPQCGGLVISSLVTGVTSGVANKGGALIRASRLTWTAKSQIHLPMAGV